MKIVVINAKKLAGGIKIGSFLLALVLVISLLFNYRQELYTAVFGEADAPLGRVIIIDPGHGGEDPGAIGTNGVYEKDLNLSIALLVGEELLAEGYTVILTRTEDKMLYSEDENIKGMRKLSDLKNRAKYSSEYPESLFVSIHMNSFGDSKYSGTQVYYSPTDTEARRLAESIQLSVKENLQQNNNRAVKEGKNLYLLENCSSVGVIIECGFMSNTEECEKLSEKEYQKELSFSIVCGIIEYMKNGNDPG